MADDFDKLIHNLEHPADSPRKPEKPRSGKAKPPKEHKPGEYQYLAFDTKDRRLRVDIRPKRGMAYALPYSNLMLLAYDDEHYDNILLTVSGMTVRIHGRNLRPIVDALKLHTCEFIEAYQPAKATHAAAEDDTIVDSIVVKLLGDDSSDEESES